MLKQIYAGISLIGKVFFLDPDKTYFKGWNLVRIIIMLLGLLTLILINKHRALGLILVIGIAYLFGGYTIRSKSGSNILKLSPGLLILFVVYPITTVIDVITTGNIPTFETPVKLLGGIFSVTTAILTLGAATGWGSLFSNIYAIYGYVSTPFVWAYSYIKGYFNILHGIKKNQDSLDEIKKQVERIEVKNDIGLTLGGQTQNLIKDVAEGSAGIADRQDMANKALLQHAEVIETKLDNLQQLLINPDNPELEDISEKINAANDSSDKYFGVGTNLGEEMRERVQEFEDKREPLALPTGSSNLNVSQPSFLDTTTKITISSIGAGILTSTIIFAAHYFGVTPLRHLTMLDGIDLGLLNTGILIASGTFGMFGEAVIKRVDDLIETTKVSLDVPQEVKPDIIENKIINEGEQRSGSNDNDVSLSAPESIDTMSTDKASIRANALATGRAVDEAYYEAKRDRREAHVRSILINENKVTDMITKIREKRALEVEIETLENIKTLEEHTKEVLTSMENRTSDTKAWLLAKSKDVLTPSITDESFGENISVPSIWSGKEDFLSRHAFVDSKRYKLFEILNSEADLNKVVTMSPGEIDSLYQSAVDKGHIKDDLLSAREGRPRITHKEFIEHLRKPGPDRDATPSVINKEEYFEQMSDWNKDKPKLTMEEYFEQMSDWNKDKPKLTKEEYTEMLGTVRKINRDRNDLGVDTEGIFSGSDEGRQFSGKNDIDYSETMDTVSDEDNLTTEETVMKPLEGTAGNQKRKALIAIMDKAADKDTIAHATYEEVKTYYATAVEQGYIIPAKKSSVGDGDTIFEDQTFDNKSLFSDSDSDNKSLFSDSDGDDKLAIVSSVYDTRSK